jgi:hypothetical protein
MKVCRSESLEENGDFSEAPFMKSMIVGKQRGEGVPEKCITCFSGTCRPVSGDKLLARFLRISGWFIVNNKLT